jgi:hypothetical protein
VAFKESFRPEKVYISPHTGSRSGASSGGFGQRNVFGKLAPLMLTELIKILGR